MLKGSGTPTCPLHARFVELMDVNLMNDIDTNERAVLFVIRDITMSYLLYQFP